MALLATQIFYGYFTTSGAGATGLTVTATVKKLTRDFSGTGDTPTISTVTTSGAVSVGTVVEVDSTNAKGLYAVVVIGIDPKADYVCCFHTAGTADLADVMSLWSEYSMTMNAGQIDNSAVSAIGAYIGNADGFTTRQTADCIGYSNKGLALNPSSIKVNDVTQYWGTVAFPANWAALGTTIAASQHVIVDSGTVTSVTNAVSADVTKIMGGVLTQDNDGDLATMFMDMATATYGDAHWATATGFLTTLGTNAPSDWIDAASIKTDAVTKIVSGVWNALLTGLTTAGSIGKKLADWVVGTLTSDYDAAKTAAPTAAANAAAVWDLTTTGHTTAGTFGGLVNGIAETTSAFQMIEIPDSGGYYAPVVVAKYRDSALTLTATYLDAKVSEVGGVTLSDQDIQDIADGVSTAVSASLGDQIGSGPKQ